MLAAERQNTERLLGAISESINRELPARIEEVVERQLKGLTGSLGLALAPIVAAAVQQAAPQVCCQMTMKLAHTSEHAA